MTSTAVGVNDGHPSSICDRANALLEKIGKVSDSGITSVVSAGYRTIRAVKDIASKIWTAHSAATTFILTGITSKFLKISFEKFNNNKAIIYIAAKVQFVALFSLPFALYGVVKYGKQIVENKDRANSGVFFGQYMTWLADSTISAITLLNEFGKLPLSARVMLQTAVAPLQGLSIGSHAISFLAHAYGVYEGKKLLDNYENAIFSMDDKKLGDVFQVEGSVIEEKLTQDYDATSRLLKGRIKSQIVNHSLCMLAIAVSSVGLILMTAGGLVIAASIVSVSASVIFLGAMVYDLIEESRFENALKMAKNEYKTLAIIAGVTSLISIPLLIGGKIIN